jgi:hypothetical protein
MGQLMLRRCDDDPISPSLRRTSPCKNCSDQPLEGYGMV